MSKTLSAAALALALAACASKPPQPHGSPFPINPINPPGQQASAEGGRHVV